MLPACIHGFLGDRLRAPEEQQTVHQVQGQPAAGEEHQHQGQGAGQPPLPEQRHPRLRRAVSETALEAPEDPRVEQGHGQQGEQHAPQEVEVDHERQGDGGEESAGGRGGDTGRSGGFVPASVWIRSRRGGEVVPAEERSEAQHA